MGVWPERISGAMKAIRGTILRWPFFVRRYGPLSSANLLFLDSPFLMDFPIGKMPKNTHKPKDLENGMLFRIVQHFRYVPVPRSSNC